MRMLEKSGWSVQGAGQHLHCWLCCRHRAAIPPGCTAHPLHRRHNQKINTKKAAHPDLQDLLQRHLLLPRAVQHLPRGQGSSKSVSCHPSNAAHVGE